MSNLESGGIAAIAASILPIADLGIHLSIELCTVRSATGSKYRVILSKHIQ